jgi:hypothetical protein
MQFLPSVDGDGRIRSRLRVGAAPERAQERTEMPLTSTLQRAMAVL